MSTNQPPAGQPEGTPAYAQPQDPWAGGFDPGLASVPTDPVQPPPDPYGYRGDVWSQQTVMHPSQYPYVPQPPPRSRVGMFIVIFLAVLLLGGGGGFAAWYITTLNATGGGNGATTGPGPTSTVVAFNPYSVKVGDCLLNQGSTEDPNLGIVACTTAKSYKVVKIATGAGIPEGPAGAFDRDTTSVAICQGIIYQSWYGYQDAADDSKDLFFCMTNNP